MDKSFHKLEGEILLSSFFLGSLNSKYFPPPPQKNTEKRFKTFILQVP